MRIGTPSISKRNGRWVLAAGVEWATSGIECPDTAWFSTHLEAGNLSPGLADAFVTGLLASAMHLGENVQVEGPVSTRLAHGLDTYQQALATWWPGSFKRVEVHYAKLADRQGDARPQGVGCTFSGGLDSFHAVHQLHPERVPFKGFSITHALMINGFDQLFDLDGRGLARRMLDLYGGLLGEWGVELVMIDTNLKAIRNATLKRNEQVHSYSSALTACAHALGGLFGRFGVSGHATYAYNQLEPDGSHPATDHLMSSDQLQVIHTGTSHSRSRKTELLADIPQVQQGLRVCFGEIRFDSATGTPLNCCECEKCVRTMAALMIIDRLDRFPTFARRRQPKKAYRNPDILAAIDDHHLKDMGELATRHAKPDWAAALEQAREKRRALGFES